MRRFDRGQLRRGLGLPLPLLLTRLLFRLTGVRFGLVLLHLRAVGGRLGLALRLLLPM